MSPTATATRPPSAKRPQRPECPAWCDEGFCFKGVETQHLRHSHLLNVSPPVWSAFIEQADQLSPDGAWKRGPLTLEISKADMGRKRDIEGLTAEAAAALASLIRDYGDRRLADDIDSMVALAIVGGIR